MRLSAEKNRQSGFTLVEIIVTILAAAIVGVIAFQYLGSFFTQSSVPIARFSKTLTFQKVIENIVADYRKNYYPSISNPAPDLNGLKIKIGGEGTTQNNSYGSYKVVYNRFVEFNGTILRDDIPGVNEDNEILKVTIKADSGELQSILFMRYKYD